MASGVDALVAAIPRGVTRGADLRGILVTTVQDVDTATGRVLATVGGDTSVWLLALEGSYTAGDPVAVLRNPWTGRAELVLGALPAGALTDPAPPVGGDPVYETVVTTIAPTFTGTWSARPGAWAVWQPANPARWTQGSTGDSGPLVGLATYGDRIAGLRATSIERVEVLARDVPHDGGIAPLTLATAAHTARPDGPPVTAGEAGTVTLAPGATDWISLDLDAAQLDAYRTGHLAALALVGSGYRALRGADVGGAHLRITYTRRR